MLLQRACLVFIKMNRAVRRMFYYLICGFWLSVLFLAYRLQYIDDMSKSGEECYSQLRKSLEYINEHCNSQNQTKDDKNSQEKKMATFKFFIYDIPSEFNEDLIKCVYHQPFMCVDLRNNGMGADLFQISNKEQIAFRDTSQFSLSVIIHNKLKTNRLRTWNPEEADLFYIPVYFALKDLCNDNASETMSQMSYMRQFIQASPHWKQGKLHFATLELLYLWMPESLYLTKEIVDDIIFITMEKINRHNQEPLAQEIVSQYPSYGHFLPSQESVLHTKLISNRNILILLPVGKRYACHEREMLKEQFEVVTDLPYEIFMKKHDVNQKFEKIMYHTNECSEDSTKNTIPWLQNSVFCLQPSGDTETRKSFYDSILSGCIPVIITKSSNPYPFQHIFNYSKFTVFVPFSNITEEHQSISEILQKIPKQEVNYLQTNMRKIAKYFQYSIPSDSITEENDALQVIFRDLSHRYNLPYDKKELII